MDNSSELKPTPGERVWAVLKRHEVRVTVAYGLFFTAVFVFLGALFYPKFMPTALTEDMEVSKSVIVDFTIISAPIAGIVLAIAAYTFLHRHKGDTPPPDGPAIRTHTGVVAVWTVVSSIFCLLAIVWGLIDMNVAATAAEEGRKRALVVEVTGSQWVWTFKYPELGIESNELNLPLDRPVVFEITSTDVNHSFWPVQLGIKVDANKLAVTKLNTLPEKLGHIEVKCAELCGLYHAYMETSGEVMTESNFQNWVTSLGGHYDHVR